jgi:cobalt-zinc-cadmium efflux system outer membrane protein
MPRKWPLALVGLLMLGGCHAPVQQNVDGLICGRANQPFDPAPLGPSARMPHASGAGQRPEKQAAAEIDSGLRLASAQEPAPKTEQLGKPQPLPELPGLPEGAQKFLKRLQVPPGVPGSNAPRIVLPDREKTPRDVYYALIDKYFPPLPPLGREPAPSPGRKPLTLEDLQKLAFTNSPPLREAATNIEAARGAMIQSGAYPNPTLTYLANSHGPSGGPLAGAGFSQTIKTMGKLKLAQAAAEMDLENARLAYRRAETDLMWAVRGGYFAVLVAQESIRANRALVELTDEVYRVFIQRTKEGQSGTYEPLQVGVFAAQARAGLITARNSYTLAWRQLAATLGLPGMPPTELAGSLNGPLPRYDFDKVLAHVLVNHTDVKTAENGILKARLNLRAAEVTAVPDVTISATAQTDMTPPGPAAVVGYMTAGVVLPVWDLNKGAIRQAQAALMSANEEPHRVRAALTSSVADAWRRYDENRALLELYRRDILPQQVQTFRSALLRYVGGALGSVAYTDLIASEQNLVSAIGAYLPILGAQWQAVADVASWLQTDDLFQLAGQVPGPPWPDLEQLLTLPCTHPCNPLQEPGLRNIDLAWPSGTIPPAGQKIGDAKTPSAAATGKEQTALPPLAPSVGVIVPEEPVTLPPAVTVPDMGEVPATPLDNLRPGASFDPR